MQQHIKAGDHNYTFLCHRLGDIAGMIARHCGQQKLINNGNYGDCGAMMFLYPKH